MVRLGIVGAGIMGTNHARVLPQVPDASLSHVVDPDRQRAALLADAYGARPLSSISELAGQVDAAIVATPTSTHATLALSLIESGIHVLIEKPIAASVEEAELLIDAAARSAVTLQVGHVERFNPVVLELENLVSDLVHINIARIGPYSGRVRDGVILDLMTHDLDLARTLARSEVQDVAAIGRRTRSDTEDLASSLLTFDNGITASLTASRVGQDKIRTIELTQLENYVRVDMLRQDITVTRVHHSEYLSNEGARYRQTGVIEVPFLEQRGEPLLAELSHFVDCVRSGRQPRVSGLDGLRAIELAQRVAAAAR